MVGAVEGNFAGLDATGNLTDSGKKPSDFILSSTKGAVNGVAELGNDGKVPSAQLPSYVDDVVEYASEANFPATGESGKIYVALDTNLTYRWSGSAYVEISPSLALGETSSTAYRGDYGAAAYAHAVTNKGTNYASGLYKITTNSEGHVTNAAAVEKSDITILGIPAQDTTYESKSAANGGTDVSLVTTGEKYSWNSKVDDVQVNGTSVITNGVANVPMASGNEFGAVLINADYGVGISPTGVLYANPAPPNYIQAGNSDYRIIPPSRQHTSVFYGLTKAAGVDMASSNNAVGTYTDAAKAAIQHMIGTDAAIAPYESDITADQAYAQNETFIMDGKLYKASNAIVQGDILTPGTNCTETKVSETYVKKTDIATTTTYGITKSNSTYGTDIFNGALIINPAPTNEIKEGYGGHKPITPSMQHKATFYGLAKAAGDSTQSGSANDIGAYTDGAKAAIQHMLGTDASIAPYESDVTADAAYAIGELFMLNGKLHQATAAIAIGDTLTVGTNCAVANAASVFPHDVQVNGTSVVSNGVANIPVGNANTYGVVKGNQGVNGVGVSSSGILELARSTNAQVKSGTNYLVVPCVHQQHMATFYGLAKAAGDTTQALSDNAVGTYTSNAQASIKAMLGVVDASTDVTISGTTPSITATANTRYLCGEVTSISFTPSSTGICEAIFTSGTTAAVLTLPNTVKLPAWFDVTSLDTNTIYDISIVDGVYGAVMTWPTT